MQSTGSRSLKSTQMQRHVLDPSICSVQSSVGDLRQSRHEEAVDGHARRDIAKLLQRFQHFTESRARDRAGRFEKVPAAKKIVALIDVLRLAADTCQPDINGLPPVFRIL